MAEERVPIDFNVGDAVAEVLLKVVKTEAYLAAVLRNQAALRAQLENREQADVLEEIIAEIDDELPQRIERAFQNLEVPQQEIDDFIRRGLARRQAERGDS